MSYFKRELQPDSAWETSQMWSTYVLCSGMNNTGWIQSHDQSQMLKGSSIAILHKGNQIGTESHWFISSTPTLQLFVEKTNSGTYGYINTLNEDGTWESSPVQTVHESSGQWQINSSFGTLSINNVEHVGVEDPYQHIASWERWMTQPLYPMNSITWRQGHGEWQGNHFVVVMREQRSSN